MADAYKEYPGMSADSNRLHQAEPASRARGFTLIELLVT
ncbi:MAG: prepilin-type N-terminal cleavage/methylation domain-containing protein, partial [Gammaproteobacteria bacterium]|nr:prepilin-type N-terminal cleavage/methylation domain-containing protein [Gammaproteobacteria bacterium]